MVEIRRNCTFSYAIDIRCTAFGKTAIQVLSEVASRIIHRLLVQNSNRQKRVELATVAWLVAATVVTLFTGIDRTLADRCPLAALHGPM
jgi:hypothetical protein